MLPKFKMATKGQLHINCLLMSEIIRILQSHSPRYGDVQVIFRGFAEIQNGLH